MADVGMTTGPVEPGPGTKAASPAVQHTRLARGVLSNLDIATSTMAYIALVMALVLSAGYITAVASVVGISGGWTSDILRVYLHIHIPWQILTFVLVGLALAMIVRGAKVST